MPALLTSNEYYTSWRSGPIIPVYKFGEYNHNNDTLSEYLARPTLSHASMDEKIAKFPQLLEKKEQLYAVQDSVSVEPEHALAFWDRLHVQREYGAYALTYHLMSE